jgi:hypothetical protein
MPASNAGEELEFSGAVTEVLDVDPHLARQGEV